MAHLVPPLEQLTPPLTRVPPLEQPKQAKFRPRKSMEFIKRLARYVVFRESSRYNDVFNSMQNERFLVLEHAFRINKFLILDRWDESHRVIIGTNGYSHHCSCGVLLCESTLFVLMRVLEYKENDEYVLRWFLLLCLSTFMTSLLDVCGKLVCRF